MTSTSGGEPSRAGIFPPSSFAPKTFSWLFPESERVNTMDPYDLTQSSSSDQIQDDFHNDEDTLKQLEKELAPKPLDFYGVLNVSRTVSLLAVDVFLFL